MGRLDMSRTCNRKEAAQCMTYGPSKRWSKKEDEGIDLTD